MKTSIRTHQGRVALVTGAGQGIGQAIALALAERGARVIATDLNLPQETARKIGPTATALQLDVTQEEAWRSASVKSRDVGDVDIVVNNAGYFPNRPIEELDLATWRKTMATNLDSHTRNRASVRGAKALHLGTASHQAAGRSRGCDWRSSIFDNRRCCIYHWAGDCRRRRSVSHRLGPYLRAYGPFRGRPN
jgi:NAD(P)-dependent dehydrogenase (short-subunit alcohol dehydrogenase family)